MKNGKLETPQAKVEPSRTLEEHLERLFRMRQRGRIELIMGTMFSGKSTELIRRINLQEVAGKRVLKVKFAADCRYKNKSAISTHTGQQKEAHPFTRLQEMDDLYLQFDCIAIDEGQFFSDLVEFSDKAAQAGKVVIISSLSGTFFREPWQNITELIPLCEKVTKLSAICKLCKRKAHFTYRTANENCKTLIGGAEMYMPLCRDCHNRESALHKQIYEGDATVINVRLEDEANNEKLTAMTSDDSDLKLRKEELSVKSQATSCGSPERD